MFMGYEGESAIRSVKGIVALALTAAVVAMGSAERAFGQWTFTRLSPDSSAVAVGPTREAGYGPTGNAAMWSGSAPSIVYLHPSQSSIYGMYEPILVGHADNRASIWLGSAGSRIDLHPAGATVSRAYDAWDAWQVGYAIIGGVQHAGYWRASAATWTSLHPAGASTSFARGVWGVQQAGHATFGGQTRAGVWTGSAASWVSMHPSGASSSFCLSTNGVRQVGYVVAGGQRRASSWNGSAASYVDQHPVGANESWINDISGGVRVGVVTGGAGERAAAWYDDSASWEDLSSFASGTWVGLYAYGVWTDGRRVRVVGEGLNLDLVQFEAVMWEREIDPPCAADFNGDTEIDFFDYLDFVAAFSSGC